MTMLTPQSLIFLAFVSILPRVAHAQEPASETPSEPIGEGNDGGATIESRIDEGLFMQLFVRRRKEHLDAVKNIRQMASYEKQYKMVSIVAENALNIIESSRILIEGAKFSPGDSTPLRNATIRDAVSTILENCALFGDVVLQLPDITHRIIKSQKTWNSTIQWSLNFVNESRHLLDEPTLAMFDLVRQELNITPRDPMYKNPYRSGNNKKATTNSDKRKHKKITKEYKSGKGPRLVNIEL